MAFWDDELATWDDSRAAWDDGQPTTHILRVACGGVDVTPYVRNEPPLVIRHGRQNATEQPTPNSAVFSIGPLPVAPPDPESGYPWTPAVGMTVQVTIAFPGSLGVIPHFTGACTDITASMAVDSAGRDVTVMQIVAVSSGLGRMARTKVGDAPWPTELDGIRVRRLIELAGVPLGSIDEGQVTVNARDVDAQYSLELAARTASECFGVLVDNRDGSVGYHDNRHRTSDTPIPVSASEILTLPSISQHVGTIINRVRYTYGPPAAEGTERPTFTVEDAESIAERGLYEVSVSAEVTNATDADALAMLMLDLYSVPRWATERLRIPLHRMPAARIDVLGNLKVSDNVGLTDMPSPAPEVWGVWVEGIEDTFTYTTWYRDLLVSDRFAVSDGNTDPIPAVACEDFEWEATCTMSNIIPNGLLPVLKVTQYVGTWSLDPDGVSYVFTFPAGGGGAGYSCSPSLNSMWIGETPYDHPDPFTIGDPNEDHCSGYDFESWGDPGLVEYQTDDDLWHPADLNALKFSGWLSWMQAFGSAGQYWSDGYIDMRVEDNLFFGTVSGFCGARTNAELSTEFGYDMYQRTNTQSPGRFMMVNYLSIAPMPGGPALPYYGNIRWSGEWGVKWRFRYARAILAGR